MHLQIRARRHADSRITGTTAVISPMAIPLVALFSAPPSSGSSMYVQFSPLGSNLAWQDTAPLLIVSGGKMSGAESSRNVIEEILPAGHAFISQHRTLNYPYDLPPVPA